MRSVFWGHAPNSQTRGKEMVEAMKKLDLLVVIDPYPSATAAMAAMVRKDGVYLLPAATQFETSGSVHGVEPLDPVARAGDQRRCSSRRPTTRSCTRSRRSSASTRSSSKNYKIVKPDGDAKCEEPLTEDILREINRSNWTIGYTGQSPERLKLHMKNMNTFDVKTLRAKGGPCDGDYFGLPWPCYGTPEIKHPGSPNLYDDVEAHDGRRRLLPRQLRRRARRRQPARRGRLVPEGLRAHHGLPGVRPRADEEARLVGRAHRRGEEGRRGQELEDRPLRRHPARHDEARRALRGATRKARAVVWNFPDGIPQHREPLYSPRPDLVAKYPTHDDKKAFWRLPTLYKTVQQENVKNKVAEKFPLVLTSGRLVEYEGGGEETRSQSVARRAAAGELRRDQPEGRQRPRRPRRRVRVGEVADGRADQGARRMVTERVGPGTTFIPFHFSGWWQGKDMLEYYPEGAAPIVRGEAVNTATTYGYDSVTMMQETKTTLCQVAKA